MPTLQYKLPRTGTWPTSATTTTMALLYHRSFDLQSFQLLQAPSHQAIYIQSRHSSKDEIILSTQKWRKPTCHRQIGQDYNLLFNNTTIAQPDGVSLMYLAKYLHCRSHGSVGMDEMINRKRILIRVCKSTHMYFLYPFFRTIIPQIKYIDPLMGHVIP